MDLAVLAKGVPPSEASRYDPVRRAMVRDGIELVLNPFDQRALRVALELRRPGERTSVLALGPPSVLPLLREARALGADRAILLTDPAFAGSDVLATTRALAGALRTVGVGLVLAGARSTDSDTGLVGPEVAGRLDVPVVTDARTIRRDPGNGPLEVVVDTDGGTATVVVAPPLVVTVGEKIAKPLHASEEAIAAVDPSSVEVRGAGPLGFSPREVGAAGSPTVVEAVHEVAPTRPGMTFATGSVGDRVRGAVEELRPLLGRTPPSPSPGPFGVAPEDGPEIVVLVSDANGRREPDAIPLLAHLRVALPGHRVLAAWYGPRPGPAEAGRLEEGGALGAFALDPGTTSFDSRDVALGLGTLLEGRPRVVAVVALATAQGREVAGQLAAARELGAVGDAVEVVPGPDGELRWSKPSFGGSTVATIRCRSGPVVATVRGSLFPLPSPNGRVRPVPWESVPVPPAEAKVRRLRETRESAGAEDLDRAAVVVAVGLGIGGPEGLARLAPSLERWGAALVGTRRVVDAGWLSLRQQVGLTGRALAPRLAVLLGVRGSVNHMVGWRRAGAILAVNRDPGAPVLREADVGIVGEIDDVLRELTEPLAAALGR